MTKCKASRRPIPRARRLNPGRLRLLIGAADASTSPPSLMGDCQVVASRLLGPRLQEGEAGRMATNSCKGGQ